jgi:RHS repeat-associated protein
VKEWISGESVNYGIVLKADDETKTKDNYLEFASLRANFTTPLIIIGALCEEDFAKHTVLFSLPWKTLDENFNIIDVTDSQGRPLYLVATYDANIPILVNYFDAEPCLQIDYICNTGLESYWSYEKVPMGRAGTAYVNQYNGGLTYVHADAETTGERMPVSLAHTYVSNHTNNSGKSWGMKLGVGFRLNVFEEILPLNCYESKSGAIIETGSEWKDFFIGAAETIRNIYEAIKFGLTDENFPDSWLEFSSEITLPDYYTLIDGDGTEHRYVKKEARYENEINSKIYLELDSDKNLVMKDEYGNQKTYSPLRTERDGTREYVYRYLTSIKDVNGNETKIIYDAGSGKIKQVVDTVQRPINLAYDGDYLKSITDPVGRMTTFSYNTEKNWLTGVNYFDNKKTELTYSEFSDRNQNAWHRSQISIVTSPEGHQYGFVYNRVDSFESSGYRVRELQHGIGGIAVTYDPKEGQGGGKSEYWWQKSQIATGFVNFVTPVWDWIAEHVILPILRIFDKNWIYQKEARWFYRQEDAPEYGDDDAKKIDFTDATELETTKFEYRPNQTKISYPLQNDDAAVTYVFDRLGRAVGARDESSGNAAFISFTEDEGVKNLPGYSAGAADVNNLLKNPSNENDGAWTGGQMETADVFAGKRAWKVSSRGSLSQNSISVESGQTYTISVFAKSLAPSGKATLNYGNDSTALDLTDTWERHTATFQADSNSIKVSIQAVGDILVDVIQLEKNGGASPFNYVENSHFNQGTSNWKLFKDDTEVSGNAKNNQYAVPGSVTEKYALVQEIPFNGTKGEMVIFGATAKASATSEEFYAYAEFFRANGTLISDDEKARKVSFNRDLDGTINQTAAVSYPLPENCASMKLYIIYDKQANPLTVSNAFVYTGVGGAKYDYANGKLDKVTTGSGTANYAYRGPEVSSVEIKRPRKESANPDAYTLEKVEFTYDNSDKHHVMSEKVTVDGTETSYTEYQYDQSHYWVLTSSSTWESLAKKNAGDVHASQEISYINNYNDVRRVTDGSGLWGEYTYDSANRNIITQSEASDGSVYTYHYNEFGADTTPNAYDILTSISSNNGERDYKNEYGYSGHGSNPVSENAPVADMLKNIQHNGTTYSFHYNMLGQVKETLIGSQTITENTYYAKEDEAINAAHKQFALAKTTYANGSSYEPVYDEKGRVVGDIYDGKATPNYTYTYSNDNALSKVENKDTGTTTQLGFDMTGRLTDVYAYKNQNIYDRVRLGYNKKGDFTGLKVLSNGSQLSNTTYEYDDRDRLKTVTAGGSAFSYEYNAGFDRLSKVTHASAGAATSYTYFQNGTNATSVLTQMSTTLPGDTFTYDYTYPQDGSSLKSSNIETISENGVLKHSYTYDKIGQLTDDNTMHYAYDAGGNLLSITDTGSNTTLHSFTYNDASWDGGNPGWKDQLQYFDGQKLTYDELGSLKTYNGNTYTWQKASQLASISGNVNAQYTYDYTGLRSSKTVDATTTRYIWAGGLLVAQDDGTNAIAWSYDGGGSMLGFTLNGTPYFYIRNLQGDVVGIYDASGTVVATYEYDAWGNQLTPQLPGSIGDLNPIRYRGYYYDTETEFYYCQSRYYNPVWCRWISADVYMDTQDGILGTNMYAYCQNDCVNRYDPSGTLAFPGEIHAFVIADIMVKNPGVVAEQTIGYKVGWGRADLIRISTGEVWEVKPNKNKYFAGALKQLQKYINGIWKKRPAGNTTVLSIGGNYISNSRNTLDGTSWLDYESPWTGSMYKVKYINKGNGIIAYDYYLVPKAKAPVVLPEVSPEFVAEMEMVLAILAMLAGLYFGMPLPNAPVKIFGN